MSDEYFTLVFKGSLKGFPGNPLRTETSFGVPFICALGNVCDEIDGFREALEEIADLGDVRSDEAGTIARRALDPVGPLQDRGK